MQRTFTADLLSKQPPYNTRELGASVIYSDASETSQRTPASNHGADSSYQQGYNQVYYMENVMPTARGYSSIGFQATVPQLSSFVPEHILECRGVGGELTYIGVQGSNVFEWVGEAGWVLYAAIFALDDFIPQVAVVRGASYFYFGTFIIYKYDFLLPGLVELEVEGVELGAIFGITSGGSQLVLHTSDSIYYSNVLDTSDFIPALSTGAGSTGILALKGTIVAALPLGQDFVLYTQYSAVHARYTGNLTFPFVFNEIPGSSGIISRNHVAYNTNTGSHIVYTNAGIQEVTASGAASIFPEIADGIAKGLLPYVNEITGQLEYESIEAINVRLSFVANRYLFISIGTDPINTMYIKSFVYDTALQRWGSINVSHTCVFEWAGTAASEGIKTYKDLSDTYPLYEDTTDKLYRDLGNLAAKYSALNKQKIAIMSNQGRVCLLAATENGQGFGDNIGTDATMPRVFIGRIKMFRSQGMVLQTLRLNKLVTGSLKLHGHDYNGAAVKLITNVLPSGRNAGTYSQRLSADSVSVEVQGAFVLTELVVYASGAGTHLQYAPPVKKYNRLLLTPLYPIEGLDTATSALTSAGGLLDEVLFETFSVDDSTSGISLVSGILRSSLITYPVGGEENPITSGVSLASGLLRESLILVTVLPTDNTATSGITLASGNLYIAEVPIVSLAADNEATSTLTLLTGSLT